MYIPTFRNLHPNIVKHMVEYVGEKDIPALIMEKLYSTDFSDEKDGCSACKRFFTANGVSDKIANKVLRRAISEIYSMNTPYLVIAKYVYSKRVSKAVYNQINKFNNNKIKTFNLEAILVEFEKFVSASPTDRYNFDDNNLVGFLVNTYRFFCKSPNGQKVILNEINAKGTQTQGADGEMSLSHFQSVSEDHSKYHINFPKVVKDIYEASCALFTVSNIVIYDLFSDYMNKELNKLEVEVKDIFKGAFSSDDIGPVVFCTEISSNTETDFGRNTIKHRIRMLEQVSDTISNSIEFERIKDLFQVLVEMDSRNLSSGNIGKLFKHKGKPGDLQYNYSIFFKILKGVVSLNEFKKYIKINKIQLGVEDYILFRKPLFYKRFNTLEDYLSLRDITAEVIQEGETIVDNVPYLTNDECYDTLKNRSSYNLVALSAIVKSEMDKNMSDYHNIPSYVKTISACLEYCLLIYEKLKKIHDVMVDCGENPFNPALVNYYYDTFPSLKDFLPDIVYPMDEMMRSDVLATNNMVYVFRFLSLRIAYYSHILKILNNVDMDIELVILTMDKNLLNFPKYIISVDDLSKLVTPYELALYLNGDSLDDSMIKKQYYLMSHSIYKENEKIYDFIIDWISKVTSNLSEYGIILTSKKLPKILQEKSALISASETHTSREFELLKSRYDIRDGFLFNKGSLLIHNGRYVHEKGYFIWIANNYQIMELNVEERF